LSEEELEEAETDADETPEPLDIAAGERKLVTQPYDYSVDQLVSHVEKGKILLIEVPYQREYVWDDSKASRLVESLLLNVPIPVCYFAENEDGSWEVIDGLQRVHSIARYLKGNFILRGLSILTELNGKRFGELPGRDQRRIESRTLRFVIITEESHPDIKFDVFERLNTGAVKLTAQELRNCIYRGAFNDGLHDLAEDVAFRHAIGRPRDARMRDEEMVLRFFALHASIPNYRPPIAQLLNEHMRANRSRSPSAADQRLFKGTMKSIADVFGGTAFRMTRDDKVTTNVNRALFDAVAISISFANRSQLPRKAGEVREGHAKLVNDPYFVPLVGRATADRSRMLGRIRMYTDMLKICGIGTSLPDLPED
jgi:hypothetical protein